MPDVISLQINVHDIAIWIIVGLVAGLLASWVMLGHGMGLFADVLVGILGAILGNIVAAYFGVVVTVPGHPLASEILIAFLGAMLLLVVIRLAGRTRRRAVV